MRLAAQLCVDEDHDARARLDAIEAEIAAALERTLAAVAPEEGCALLLGQRLETRLTLQTIWPCRNTWLPAEERSQRFRLDPREQLLAQRWGRQRGQLVVGAAHSHPSSAAVPSATAWA